MAIFDASLARCGQLPKGELMRMPMVVGLLALSVFSACAPEIGSKAWCEKMEAKDKGDWTANEAADYLQHCLIRSDH